MIECSTIVRGLSLLVKLKFANPLNFAEDDTLAQMRALERILIVARLEKTSPRPSPSQERGNRIPSFWQIEALDLPDSYL